MGEGAGALRVAYLVSGYPALSLAFVEREIQGLRGIGATIDTFTVRPPDPAQLLTPLMRDEAAATTVLLESRAALAGETWTLLRSRPRAFARLLRRAAHCGAPALRSRVWQMFYLVEAVRLYDELARRGIRHVHVHFANNSADIARLVVELGTLLDGPDSGWRWTLTMHGPTEFEDPVGWGLAGKVADAAAVACISDFTRSQLMRLVPPDLWPKLQVVRMSVDGDRFRPTKNETGDVRRGRLLYVGRLVAEKGGPVLVEAVRRLADRGIDVELRMVGSGPLERTLRERIDALGVGDRVVLTGGLGQDDLPAEYHWADVFCLPSFQEGLPVVLMEALSSGVPVVTTRIAGIPEMVDDSNGRVVPPGRADLLADALAELLRDPDLRARLGRAGRERMQRDYAAPVAAQAQAAFLSSV